MEIDFEAVRRVFLAESEEHLAHMEQALLALDARPDDAEAVDTAFRGAHSLKGGAASLGFDALTQVGHALEDVLARVRARTLPVTAPLVTLLLACVDALRRMLPETDADAPVAPEVRRLMTRLRRVASASGAEEGRPVAPGDALAPPSQAVPAPAARQRTLRVDVERLDHLLETAGEALVALSRLRDTLAGRALADDACDALEQQVLGLHELVLAARLVPVGASFRRQARVLRDAAQATGKQARLVIEGEQTELDLALVEQIRDPLTHMVRNAVDHGLEPPDARRAAGKDPTGTVTLRARQELGNVVIEVRDDGVGLDPAKLRRSARALGIAEADTLGEAELANLIFRPGFSTAERVTEMSGRGVGLDVVRRNAEALRGTATVEARAGLGTCLRLRLPLTLVVVEGFAVGVGEERYVIPAQAVSECLDLPAGLADDGREQGMLNLRGEALPVMRLRRLLRVVGPAPEREYVVVVRHGRGRAGLAVDRLLGLGPTVLKPLGRLFLGLPGVSGSSVGGDGRVALVLDVDTLLAGALAPAAGPARWH